MKELEKPIIVEPVTEVVIEQAIADEIIVEDIIATEVVVETPPFKQQIINSLNGLMTKGLTIKTISSELKCSDAEMLELFDPNSMAISFDVIDRLSKLSNSTFIIA